MNHYRLFVLVCMILSIEIVAPNLGSKKTSASLNLPLKLQTIFFVIFYLVISLKMSMNSYIPPRFRKGLQRYTLFTSFQIFYNFFKKFY